MSALDPTMAAALKADVVTIFGALKMEFADLGTKRLLDGSAEIEIDGELYRGEEPAFGVWDGVDELEDGTGDEAPAATITILPVSEEAALSMSDPSVQGTPISIMIGVRNDATGLVIGTPWLEFYGEIDVPLHMAGTRSIRIEYDSVGGMEELFFNEEGIRLSASWQAEVWANELGLSHRTGITDVSYWGGRAPSENG